jgi:hypothetical protein
MLVDETTRLGPEVATCEGLQPRGNITQGIMLANA